ncbi:MAG: cation:dicarboxylase symporter family transporter [Clostridiales bacterium]|jgi:L-cystine uptake protein TcyP (sodium:dicarboxylate symporter family)|nr:cation:dicarboxylase symporter family transporter [Clostridiales bacterium]
MNNFYIFLAILVFAVFVAFMVLTSKKFELGFTLRVVIALGLGLLYGVCIQLIFGVADANNPDSLEIARWVNIMGSGFTRALSFLVIPLVFVSIVSAIAKLGQPSQGLKQAGLIIGFLLVTTAIAAFITMGVVYVTGLNANDLIESNPGTSTPQPLPTIILNLIPNNLFAAFSGSNVLPIVFISIIVGIAYLSISKQKPDIGARFNSFLTTAYEFVLKLVDFVIGFTPYGILAIIAYRSSSAGWDFVYQLGYVVLVSYIAMAIVFGLHLIIMACLGVNPIRYLRKTGATLLFAFTSRSSSATLPLTIQTQKSLGVPEGTANLAGSFGTCIGQNACAGIYPVTVALLVGLVQGWDVWSAGFLLPLGLYAVIASIGTAGVGGGATNVSLMVLGLMGLPIELVTILISVDFLIDMGRTAVNVNDSILAGFVVGKLQKEIDKSKLSNNLEQNNYTSISTSTNTTPNIDQIQ